MPLFVVVLAPLFIHDEPMRSNGIVSLVHVLKQRRGTLAIG